jgi:hypothetical protein
VLGHDGAQADDLTLAFDASGVLVGVDVFGAG